MQGQTTNQILQQVEQQISAKVDQNLQPAFQKVVNLGMNIMHSEQSHKFMVDELKKEGEPAEKAGEGVAKLMGMIAHKSQGTLLKPKLMRAFMAGAQVLLCEALDFMEKSGMIQITNDTVAHATQAMTGYLLQMLGVSKEKMQSLAQQAAAKQGEQGAMPQDAMNQPATPKPMGILGQAQGAM